MTLREAITDLQSHPPRRGPSCTAGVVLRSLPLDDQQAVYAAADLIAAHNSPVTWRDLAAAIAQETGADINWARLSRHCRRMCACRR